MKKYGDDADQFHNQGTRVEESKKWHEQNQVRHNYSYHSSSKPKSTYKPKTSNKSTYKPDYSKTYYKPRNSNKTNSQHRKKQSRNTSHQTYNKYNAKNRQSYRSISVEEANRRIRQQNKKSESSSNSNDDNWLMAVFCICGIIAFFIAFAILENPIGFAPILIGLLGVVFIILWISEKISSKIKSVKSINSSFAKMHYGKITQNLKRKMTSKNKTIIGLISLVINFSACIFTPYYDVYFAIEGSIPAIFLILPENIKSSKILSVLSLLITVPTLPVFCTFLLDPIWLKFSIVRILQHLYLMRMFLIEIIIWLFNITCAVLLYVNTESKKSKRNSTLKQELLFLYDEKNGYRISKTKIISWFVFFIGTLMGIISNVAYYSEDMVTLCAFIIGCISRGSILAILILAIGWIFHYVLNKFKSN